MDRHGEVSSGYLNGREIINNVIHGNTAGRADGDRLVTTEAHERIGTGNLVGGDLTLSRSSYE